MMSAPTTPQNLGFLLNRFRRAHPPLIAALATSGDGLLLAMSEGIERDEADTVSASITGVMSLGKGAAKVLGAGHMEVAVLQMSGGWVVSYTPSDHVVLIALAPLTGLDIGAVQHGLVLLGEQIADALNPGPRTSSAAAIPALPGPR
jgi:predicted regulator of Ras-like GTPase activity (Roadblock/LC7/MglB family)